MKNLKKLLLISISLLGIAGLWSISANAQAEKPFNAKPLVDAPKVEIQQAALDFTHAYFNPLGEAPVVLLTKSVTKEELPSLGLSAIDSAAEFPPLALVAVKGNFDVGSLRHSALPFRVKYIVYVFDLKAGVPTLIEYSVDGSRFRKLLNDPTLPEELSAPDFSNGPMPDIPPMTPAPKLPYGSVAPGMVPPGPLPTEAP